MSLTTSLSLAQAAVIRLLARSASYPCLFIGLRQCPLAATYPAPGSYNLRFSLTCVAAKAIFCSLGPTFFLEFVSRFPASFILLTNPEPV